MPTISLKLPDSLLTRLEKESRARGTTKSSLVRECLEKQLPAKTSSLKDLPKLPPGESFYDKALPILKKAWRRRARPRDQSEIHGRLRQMTVIVDTGVLVALIDPDTEEHAWAREEAAQLPVPWEQGYPSADAGSMNRGMKKSRGSGGRPASQGADYP